MLVTLRAGVTAGRMSTFIHFVFVTAPTLASCEPQTATAGSADPTVAAEIQRQVQMALDIQAETLRNQADEQMRRQNKQLEDKMKEMNAQKAAEIEQAVTSTEDAFERFAKDQASKAEELENASQIDQLPSSASPTGLYVHICLKLGSIKQ